MKGVNTLRLNQATVIDALQEYLNRRMTVYAGKQKVISVIHDAAQYAIGNVVFIVKIEEKKDVR